MRLLGVVLVCLGVTLSFPTLTLWFGKLSTRIFDPHYAWMFWLGIGIAIGASACSRLRLLEARSHGEDGGPSFVYLRNEARLIRVAIRYKWVRILLSCFDQDVVAFERVLVSLHGFPPLPETAFSNAEGMRATAEYIRRILPNLSAQNVEEARAAATRYSRQISRKRVA